MVETMIRAITWQDLQFERRIPRVIHSERGVPQVHWTPVGMPLIPRNALNAVFYLYRDRSDAIAGRAPGGTGFIVQYEADYRRGINAKQLYAVTNYHVAVSGFWPTIRLNTKDGGIVFLTGDPTRT